MNTYSLSRTPRLFPNLAWRLLLSATLFAISLSFLGSAAAWSQDAAPPPAEPSAPPILKIGSPAPSFTLPGVDGKMHSLRDYASSKVLVVIFSCDHCPVAQMYEKRIKQLASDYKGRGVAVVVIMGNDPKAERIDELAYSDLGDTLAEMKIRAKYRHFNYPYLYDGATQSVTLKYGPTATPHVFVFDEKRILRYEGRIDSNPREELATKHEARDAIDALLAGQPVQVTDTPTPGCSTKWSYKRAYAAQETAENNQKPVSLDLASTDDIKTLRVNSGTGGLLLVNVWATWCAPCMTEFPELEKMVRMYGGRKIQFVTLSINAPDERDKVLGFLKGQHAYNRNLIFNGNDAADAVKAFGTDWMGGAPYTVLIGTNGEVLYKTTGAMNVLNVRRAILTNMADDYYIGQHAYWNSTF
jgi:thiol-disulfide isomerase/thioredoxin